VRSEGELRDLLARIDGRGYNAYRDLKGAWRLGDLELHVDHVQGDPFAAPSRMRLRVPMARARFASALFAGRVSRIALQDFLARAVRLAIESTKRVGGSGRSGLVAIDAGAQEVLERTATLVEDEAVEARLAVGLPAAGRRVLGRGAAELLAVTLPALAENALCAEALDAEAMARHLRCAEDQEQLRAQLDGAGLVAFVADGSILPRAHGASDLPLLENAVSCSAPPSLRVELATSGSGGSERVAGLGIPCGVTLIVGGGYHGKSTLLRSLERSVHPHVPGDGREGVVCRHDAVKIRAEDGRRVEGSDIGAFIGELPQGRSTRRFRSDDASGSTSQAANIVEALEAGSRLLLLDEDTSATNFMVRDARMQALVAKEHEPITPFLDRVRELWEDHGVSTVLVMGGCGDYLDVADTVIEMRDYRPRDVTSEARRIADAVPSARRPERPSPLTRGAPRVPLAASLDPSRGRRAVKIGARGLDLLEYGSEHIDLRAVEQILDASQTRAIGHALEHMRRHLFRPGVTLASALDALEALVDERGLDALALGRAGDPERLGDLARPRRYEVAAALNRLRGARVEG
jgi:predicted ABC-class ATPase